MQHFWKILYTLFSILLLCFVCTLNTTTNNPTLAAKNGSQIEYLTGEITKITNNVFTVQQKDINKEIIFEADPDFLFNHYAKGDTVTLYKIENTEETIYDIVDYVHLDGISICVILFCLLTIFIAKRKGFFSIISLMISTSLFYFLFLKALQAGYSPLQACLLFVLGVTFLTIPLIHGFNRKSGSSLLAINLGFLMSLAISLLFKNMVRLGDVPSETLRNLNFQLPELDIGGILLVILFMGAVGALIDVAVTISSAIFEATENQTIELQKSFKLGMEVGKDILGSMINTLLLAYLASSIPFFILITQAEQTSLKDLLNYDFVAMEVTRTLIGATSLVILVPISAVIASWLLSRKQA